MKFWKASKKFMDEHGANNGANLPEPIKAALVIFFLYGMFAGVALMIAIQFIYLK